MTAGQMGTPEYDAAWSRVVAATETHNVERISADLSDANSWAYIRCSCGDIAREQWEFTDHLRRIVFDAALGITS